MSRVSAPLPALAAAWLLAGGGATAMGPGAMLFLDGFESGDTSAWATLVAFRMTDLDFRDPHLFANVPPLGCLDVTDFSQFGIEGLNPTLQTQIQQDSEPDGLLDLSIANTFRPLSQTAGTTSLGDLVYPDCSAPMASTSCTLPGGAPHSTGNANNQGDGAECLVALAGTTSGYSPAIIDPVAPVDGTCYAANLGTTTIPILVPITLLDTWIGGEWFESPATEIHDGLIRGFLAESTANATIIPEGTTGIASIDGEPLSSLLRGGVGSCSQPSPSVGDKDSYLSTSGWYVYLNFTATKVPYSEL